jgi:hypothetical protein
MVTQNERNPTWQSVMTELVEEVCGNGSIDGNVPRCYDCQRRQCSSEQKYLGLCSSCKVHYCDSCAGWEFAENGRDLMCYDCYVNLVASTVTSIANQNVRFLLGRT